MRELILKLHARAAPPHPVQPHMMRSRVGTPPLCRLQKSRYFPGLRPVSRIMPVKRTPAGMTKPAEPAVAYICAASAPDLDTIVHGLIAVKAKGKQEQQHAVRFLVDTGATESCISEACVSEIGAPVRNKLETLSMANGSIAAAQSKGSVVLPINMQDYWSEAVLEVFPMNSNFDVILVETGAPRSPVILYSTGLMRFESPSTGKYGEIVLQPVSHGTVCCIISSVDLDTHIETGDTVYTCHETAQESESNPIDSDKVQVILEQYSNVFPDELPAELPPERSVYHTIPLKDSMLFLLHANHIDSVNLNCRSANSKSLHCWQRVT